MKWKTHITIGISYAAASGRLELLTASMLAVGSVFPDIIDRSISFGIESVWQKVHRKTSHWWLIYLTLTALCIYTRMQTMYFFFIGGLLHIYADSLTKSGVPFLSPFEAGYGLRKAKTGEISEYLMAGVIIGLIFILGFLPLPIWMTLSAVFVLTAVINSKAYNPIKQDKRQIALAELSELWTKYNIKPDTNQNTAPTESPTFRHNAINEFCKIHLKNIQEAPLKVITEILHYLDEHGDVSSMSTDASPYTEPATRQALSKISLLQHSLDTANEIMACYKNHKDSYPMLIAALGHDIGKIPDADTMNIGEHPKASVLFLNSIQGFKELPLRSAIEEAILNHHSTGGGELAEKLRLANSEARRKEAASITANQAVSSTLDKIDSNLLIETLRANINVSNGKKFETFCFNNTLYIKTDAFWKAVAKSIQISANTNFEDSEYRKKHLLEAVRILSKEGIISNNLLAAGTFTQLFAINFRDGSTQKIFATPLTTDSFSNHSEPKASNAEIISVTPLYPESRK